MNIIDQLNALAAEVRESTSDLNSGGCGVFAAMVGKALIQKGIPASCFACYDTVWDDMRHAGNVDEARANVSDPADLYEWNDNDVSLSHVGVEFVANGETLWYDSNGVVKPSRSFTRGTWIVQDGRFTVEEMEAMAERPHNWNDWFDRSQIPDIQHLVEERLHV